MTEYKMTDEKRKLLTEKLLEECWHIKQEPRTITGYVCEKCGDYIKWGNVYDKNGNHTFTIDTDMLAVFRKIRDIGKWSEFYRFTGKHWLKDDDAWEREEPLEVWLFMGSYERACCLAADFLEVQG